MTLPTLFASLTTATGAQLDNNFAALGDLTPIPCTVAGTNALSFTPAVNTPSVTSYPAYGIFTGIAAATNTGATTAYVGALAPLAVYKDTISGPVALSGGEIRAGNLIALTYDPALAAGAGGFHMALPGVSVSGSPVSGDIASWTGPTTLGVVAATGTGSVVLADNPTIAGGSATLASLQTTTAYTAATLPAATSGLRGAIAYITDASTATASVGGAITGGGANVLPVFCNGTAWVYG